MTITASSACTFNQITLTNTGGKSGWVTGNACNFIINTVTNPITNCDKIYLDELCYNATQAQTTTLTVLNNNNNGTANTSCTFATINGVPCSAANVTIEPINPLPFGCFFNSDGTRTIPAGTLPFNTENLVHYRFRSIANPCIFSDIYRVDFGISPKVIPAFVNVWLHAGSPPIEVYSNGSANVLNTPLLSQINTSISGVCGYIPAIIDASNVSNTITVTETTSSINPYYKIDIQTGAIVFRAPYNSSNPPPAAPNASNPNTYYQLTYNMCINNTGATTFCASQVVNIIYYYGSNKLVNPNNNLETLIISPNPSSDGIYTLTLNKEIKSSTLEVYNMIGQKMYGEKVSGLKEHQLFLDNLPKGTYLLRLENNGEIITKNIVRQ